MPIYEYRCATCGHQAEVLQKMSDAPLKTCPVCGRDSFSKQISAAGFQLKGSGWYATDFKGSKTSGPGKEDAAGKDSGGGADTGKSDSKAEAAACGAGACPACQ
ncbi:MAG TPA: zinc ribbon domain-containing protein [Burkholderiales bacterium]|jgi:putative FmdB family regulatory protein|nr:zinc ribbon domain-containing protein [Burkholderiales bacterium]